MPQGVRVCGSPRSCKSEPNPQTGSDNGGKGFMPPPRFPSRLRLARNLEHPRRSKSDVFWIRFFWCLLGSILGPLPPKKPQDRQKRSQDRTPRPPQEAPRTFRPKRQPRLPKTVRNGRKSAAKGSKRPPRSPQDVSSLSTPISFIVSESLPWL